MSRRVRAPRLPSLDAPRWRQWNCRQTGRQTSARYLGNCRRVARYFISRYLLAGRPIAFRRLLRESHRLLVAGLTEVPHSDYDPRHMFPGHFRHQVIADHAGDVAAAPRFSALLRPGRLLRVYDARGTRVSLAHGAPGPIALRLVYAGLSWHVPWRRIDDNWFELGLAVPGYRTRRPIWSDGRRVRMYLPPAPTDAERVLAAAGSLLSGIATLVRRHMRGLKVDHDALTTRLAHYYYLMTYSHPFCRQNNSLVMNQVNTVLFLTRGVCIDHGLLDIVAGLCTAALFVEIFRGEVEAQIRVGERRADAPGGSRRSKKS